MGRRVAIVLLVLIAAGLGWVAVGWLRPVPMTDSSAEGPNVVRRYSRGRNTPVDPAPAPAPSSDDAFVSHAAGAIGAGVRTFAVDHRGTLPDPRHLSADLAPYVAPKWLDALPNFRWTCPLTRLAAGASATKPLGEVRGANGVATVSLDGQVAWSRR